MDGNLSDGDGGGGGEARLMGLHDDWSLDHDEDDVNDVIAAVTSPYGDDTLDHTFNESGSDDVILGGKGSGDDEDAGDEEDVRTVEDYIETNPFDNLPFSSLYFRLLAKRKSLPVWAAKDDFVLACEESSVVLVTGRAGSGKSTQVPQWCACLAKESNFELGSVVCSQPFALAAESLATQVAREMDFTSVGNEVGFETPEINNYTDETILKFCTDDILLREMADDPFLRNYNYVIIDEFQERKTSTDLILALIRLVLPAREDLRLIVISLDHEMGKLEEFFEGVPIVDLHFLESALLGDEEEEEKEDEEQEGGEREGKSEEELEIRRRQKAKQDLEKRLDVEQIETSSGDYCRAVVNLVSDLHCANQVEGNFLVFMPSAKDCYEVVDFISREVAIRILREEDSREFRISQLHHQLPSGAQQAVYEMETSKAKSDANGMTSSSSPSSPPAPSHRHIVVCDGIAESSFSLDNVDAVIDCDHAVVSHFNSRFRTHHDSMRRISACSSQLRMSRCRPGGKYFRLNFADRKQEIQMPRNAPKITTTELSEAILLMKRILHKLDVPFSKCQLLDPPGPEAYMLALEELDYHGVLDENGRLSDLGVVMSEIPLPISQAKVIITSCGEDCTEEIVTIMAMLNSPSCFTSPSDTVRYEHLIHKSGDHFTLLNVYNQFVANGSSEMWCQRHALDYRSLLVSAKKRHDLVRMMEQLELPISKPIADPKIMEASVKKALLAGYFMQLARDTDESGNYHVVRDKHTTRIHPHSKLLVAAAASGGKMPRWIIYDQFHLSGSNFLSGICSVTAQLIVEIVPSSYIVNLPPSESQHELMASSGKQPITMSAVTSQPQHSRQRSSSDDGIAGAAGEEAGDEEDDVITQAMRNMTYAYNQSSEYLMSEECLIQ